MRFKIFQTFWLAVCGLGDDWSLVASGLSSWQQAYKLKGLILAQNERWRRGLGMQVVRKGSFGSTRAAKGRVTRGYLPPDPG